MKLTRHRALTAMKAGAAAFVAGTRANAAAPPWVQANGPAVKKFSDVMRRTAQWANKNHDRSGDILVKYSTMEPQVVHAMTRAVFAERIDPLAIQALLDLAARYGNIPAFRAEDFLAVSK